MADREEKDDFEVFKIGRMRVIFPPDLSDEELQLTSMILYSYIQTQKYKQTHENIWKRVEKPPDRLGIRPKEQTGIA